MPKPHEYEYETELLRILEEERLVPKLNAVRRNLALQLLREAYRASGPKGRSELRKAAALGPTRPPPETPRWLVARLRRALGTAGLHRWAQQTAPQELKALGDEGTLSRWLQWPASATSTELLAAGLHYALGLATPDQERTIDAQIGPLLRRKNMTDLITYSLDPRSRPSVFDEIGFVNTVKGELAGIASTVPKPTVNFIIGALSLDGYLTQDPVAQRRHARTLLIAAEEVTRGVDPNTNIRNAEAYAAIEAELEQIRTPGAGPPVAYYEEFAFVARELIGNASAVPINGAGLRERVAAALSEYVPGQAGGALTLPSLDADHGTSADLVADNIRAVGLIYAAWSLEEAKLFQVLDRVVESFMVGQLPVGNDAGGKRLAEYYFEDDDDKLTEAARRMTYTRVLGVPGGEVSKEAPPNRAFQDLFLRFLASVSEYDRQRRVSDVMGINGRSREDALSLTGEQVRKSGRDLAANASLYGYGGTFFVAKRLARQIERALTVLNTREILSAYGVQGPFQVIERVVASDLGGTPPNMVRLKTMAESGKCILDLVAKYIPAWTARVPGTLFAPEPLVMVIEPATGDSVRVPLSVARRMGVDPVSPSMATAAPVPPASATLQAPTGAISYDDQTKLMHSVEYWLAVNGIKDEQRARLGEPEMSAPAPSIPSATPDGGGAVFDQLRQMVSAGQTPSLDQLKALIPDGGMVRL